MDVSRRIHARPELGYEETFAHDLLTGVLEDDGLAVTRSARASDTAFEASAGVAGPTVAVVCEYDALPGIGHACGHNVIAAAGLGAGLAAAALADELGRPGRSSSAPRPRRAAAARSCMIDGGAFDGVDAALMVHPADVDLTGHGRHRHPPGARSTYLGRGRPRRRRPRPGPQRPRRRRPRLHERGRAAPAHRGRASGSTGSSPTAATSPTSSRRSPAPSGTCARRRSPASSRSRSGSWPAWRRAPPPPAARWSSPGPTRSTPTCVDNGRHRRAATGPTRDALGPHRVADPSPSARVVGQHRHGQRQLRGARPSTR